METQFRGNANPTTTNPSSMRVERIVELAAAKSPRTATKRLDPENATPNAVTDMDRKFILWVQVEKRMKRTLLISPT